MTPRYPVFVISKGRWDTRLTVRSLEAIRVPYRIVIEPQEYDQYAAVIPPENILVLPFSNLGLGSIPARNWVWEKAIAEGAKRHWILDDNIRDFYRLHNNERYRIRSAAAFCMIEDWVDRYENVPMAGMQYASFAAGTTPHPPIIFNTRIYSCILLANDIDMRWRGRYNEDTDLSLRILKAGYCTALFLVVLCGKTRTMQMKGGNTDELYRGNGRYKMAEELMKQHPDVVKMKWRWGRWQHDVDYSAFKYNKLIFRPGVTPMTEINNYGLTLGRI